MGIEILSRKFGSIHLAAPQTKYCKLICAIFWQLSNTKKTKQNICNHSTTKVILPEHSSFINMSHMDNILDKFGNTAERFSSASYKSKKEQSGKLNFLQAITLGEELDMAFNTEMLS
ncbi:hypothetical protein GDO86_002016 [Hymenochirus boettgeri]|uniref:Uncharacterized protein n=1 Tax=Hymenochirus boettgeri TaxID=247094 RepID=A0A8T2KHU4_9PIPI|nr:hypothetical protein GDO86_002016 [Hymenochirus boettgeri]